MADRGSAAVGMAGRARPAAAASFDPLGDLLGGLGSSAPAAAAAAPSGVIGYNKNGVALYFQPVRDQANPTIVNVNCVFQNGSPAMLTNFVFQAAVPKVWPWAGGGHARRPRSNSRTHAGWRHSFCGHGRPQPDSKAADAACLVGGDSSGRQRDPAHPGRGRGRGTWRGAASASWRWTAD